MYIDIKMSILINDISDQKQIITYLEETMELRECFETLGGDYDDALSRMMNDALVEKFIMKFPSDKTMDAMLAALENNDTQQIFQAAHTMKGIAANLGFTRLCKASSELTEQLRGKTDVTPDAGLVGELKDAYSLVIDTLSRFSAEKD